MYHNFCWYIKVSLSLLLLKELDEMDRGNLYLPAVVGGGGIAGFICHHLLSSKVSATV